MNQLEDQIPDVVGKAIRGLGRKVEEVASEIGVTAESLQRVIDQGGDEVLLRKIADKLRLDPDALVGLPSYQPEVPEIAGVKRWVMPFREWTVNAWSLEIDGVSLLFDTGWNRTDILKPLNSISPAAVLITHQHEDHVGGLGVVEEKGVRVISEVEALDAGQFQFGKMGIKVIDLSGHCVPTASYLITGFERPLWVVGDAIFAGSMGGCQSTQYFQMAMQSMRVAIQELDPECLILPGHGPMTSIQSELEANPFRPCFC